MKKISIQLTFLSFLSLSINLMAEPRIIEALKPYKVETSSVIAMFEHMNKYGLSDQNDYQFHGGSSWNISWNYQTQQRRSKCYLKKLKLKVKATHKFPELSVPLENSAMTETWNDYVQALLIHQKKHVELAISAAAVMEGEIKEISSKKHCEEFRPLIADIHERVSLDYQAKHQHFDLITDLGRKDGASFDSFLKTNKLTKNISKAE